MKIELTHPHHKVLRGFRFFWAKKVTGFNPEQHCMASLRGPRLAAFRPDMPVGPVQIAATTGEEVYICGVGEREVGNWNRLEDNFHLVIRSEPGAPEFFVQTYNGFTVTVSDSVPIPITPLPAGWRGLPRSFTRCRNFQYGVQRFCYPT